MNAELTCQLSDRPVPPRGGERFLRRRRACWERGVSKSVVLLTGYRWFESISLQRGVTQTSSLLPAYADHVLVCFRPSCIPSYPRMSRSVSGRLRADAPPWRVGNPPPQGSSLESGLCCPGLSSLNRPHPPHSQAHHDFAARRLIRNAFAVRERLGDPRVVPGFR